MPAFSGGAVTAVLDGSVTGVKISTTVDRWTSGSSASGTPGTAICSLAATSGNRLTAIGIAGAGTAAANTFARITVTYDDDTTTVVDTTGAGFNLVGNRAIITYAAGGTGILQVTALNTSKAIKSVAAETLGSGTGTRTVAISATEAKLT